MQQQTAAIQNQTAAMEAHNQLLQQQAQQQAQQQQAAAAAAARARNARLTRMGVGVGMGVAHAWSGAALQEYRGVQATLPTLSGAMVESDVFTAAAQYQQAMAQQRIAHEQFTPSLIHNLGSVASYGGMFLASKGGLYGAIGGAALTVGGEIAKYYSGKSMAEIQAEQQSVAVRKQQALAEHHRITGERSQMLTSEYAMAVAGVPRLADEEQAIPRDTMGRAIYRFGEGLTRATSAAGAYPYATTRGPERLELARGGVGEGSRPAMTWEFAMKAPEINQRLAAFRNLGGMGLDPYEILRFERARGLDVETQGEFMRTFRAGQGARLPGGDYGRHLDELFREGIKAGLTEGQVPQMLARIAQYSQRMAEQGITVNAREYSQQLAGLHAAGLQGFQGTQVMAAYAGVAEGMRAQAAGTLMPQEVSRALVMRQAMLEAGGDPGRMLHHLSDPTRTARTIRQVGQGVSTAGGLQLAYFMNATGMGADAAEMAARAGEALPGTGLPGIEETWARRANLPGMDAERERTAEATMRAFAVTNEELFDTYGEMLKSVVSAIANAKALAIESMREMRRDLGPGPDDVALSRGGRRFMPGADPMLGEFSLPDPPLRPGGTEGGP